MSFVSNANSILAIFESAKNLPARGEIFANGLQIQILGEDSNLTDWIADNFSFISDSSKKTVSDVHTVSAYCSDNRMREIIAIFDSGQFKSHVYTRRGVVFYRIQISSHLNIDYFPSLGCAWLTQQSGWMDNGTNNLIAFLYSSRTPLPFRELRIGLIDIINRFFESRGWHTFHAGAVSTPNRSKTIMIVGASSSGKTSLILQLLSSQFHYVGNERLFCKLTGDSIRIRSFPQPVNIGIGSALHHKGLRDFVERPDRCTYYQSMFEPTRVFNSPKEQLAELPDKLKFLPGELIQALQAPNTASNAVVNSIIVPAIGDEPTTIVEVLTPEEVTQILCDNYFAVANDQVYPRWLPIEYEYDARLDPSMVISRLSQLPAWRIRYSGNDTESVLPKLNELIAA